MENMDFSGSSSITQLITEEKKIDEPQMMEFSSSVADLVPTPSEVHQQDVYVNPSNNRVAGLSLPNDPQPQQQQKKTKNPFNLTDDQMNALIAGAVAVVLFSGIVQSKLAGLVPNFSGINGTIANVLVGAVLFYFAQRFVRNNR